MQTRLAIRHLAALVLAILVFGASPILRAAQPAPARGRVVILYEPLIPLPAEVPELCEYAAQQGWQLVCEPFTRPERAGMSTEDWNKKQGPLQLVEIDQQRRQFGAGILGEHAAPPFLPRGHGVTTQSRSRGSEPALGLGQRSGMGSGGYFLKNVQAGWDAFLWLLLGDGARYMTSRHPLSLTAAAIAGTITPTFPREWLQRGVGEVINAEALVMRQSLNAGSQPRFEPGELPALIGLMPEIERYVGGEWTLG